MVLQERIELSTSPLPRGCSTTELLQRTGRDRATAGARAQDPRTIQRGMAHIINRFAKAPSLRWRTLSRPFVFPSRMR